jgi:hypothetical protein
MLLGKYWIFFDPMGRCSASDLHNPFIDVGRKLNGLLSDFVFVGSELDSGPRDHLCLCRILSLPLYPFYQLLYHKVGHGRFLQYLSRFTFHNHFPILCCPAYELGQC